MKMYVVKKISQKEGKQPFTYLVLLADLGYEKKPITMDKAVIAELLATSVGALFAKCTEVNKEYHVADFVLRGDK